MATLTGCAATSTSANSVSGKHKTASSHGLTEAQVVEDIRHTEVNKRVTEIHVLGLSNSKGRGVAFASFQEDGLVKYANVLMTADQGTGVGIFSAPKVKGTPLQSNEQITQDGFIVVTGVVVDDPIVTHVILTFANGDVQTVPVTDGHFWFLGQMGSSGVDANVKHIIGVSNQGEIMINQRT